MRVKLMIAAALVAGATAGAVAATAQQPRSATTDITVRGIEDVITQLNSMQGNKNAAQASLVLNLLKGLGRQGPAEGGRSRLDYAVSVSQDGKVLVNGVDIAPMIETATKLRKM